MRRLWSWRAQGWSASSLSAITPAKSFSKDTPVSEIMTSPVKYVTPQETMDECMRIMTANRVRHLPVVEDEKVVGIVSIGDLVNWIISAQADTIHQLHSYITGK